MRCLLIPGIYFIKKKDRMLWLRLVEGRRTYVEQEAFAFGSSFQPHFGMKAVQRSLDNILFSEIKYPLSRYFPVCKAFTFSLPPNSSARLDTGVSHGQRFKCQSSFIPESWDSSTSQDGEPRSKRPFLPWHLEQEAKATLYSAWRQNPKYSNFTHSAEAI